MLSQSPLTTVPINETQQMPRWLMNFIALLMLGIIVLLVLQFVQHRDQMASGLGAFVILLILGFLFSLRFYVTADADSLQLRTTPVINIRKNFRWEEIKSMKVEGKTRIVAFGGYGIRFAGDGWGYIYNGKEVISLVLENKRKKYYFTTDHADAIMAYYERSRQKRTGNA